MTTSYSGLEREKFTRGIVLFQALVRGYLAAKQYSLSSFPFLPNFVSYTCEESRYFSCISAGTWFTNVTWHTAEMSRTKSSRQRSHTPPPSPLPSVCAFIDIFVTHLNSRMHMHTQSHTYPCAFLYSFIRLFTHSLVHVQWETITQLFSDVSFTSDVFMNGMSSAIAGGFFFGWLRGIRCFFFNVDLI